MKKFTMNNLYFLGNGEWGWEWGMGMGNGDGDGGILHH